MKMRISLALLFFFSFLLPLAAQTDGKPVIVSRSLQYDLASKITGRTYRLMVAMPPLAEPSVAYPVLYLLDGNGLFATAAAAETAQSYTGVAMPAIIVGIGYATDEEVLTMRTFDLTPTVSNAPDSAGVKSGGGDAFLRAIEEEIKPFIAARYKVDKTQQVLYGDSLGGLLALRSLFRNPTAFSTYLITSPSIWWNGGDVLAGEPAFAKRARTHELHLRVLMMSAGDEQYFGEDPKLLAASALHRMVDNASELAHRLAALAPAEITVVRTIFPGEVHTSVTPASISRGLRFAFPVKAQP